MRANTSAAFFLYRIAGSACSLSDRSIGPGRLRQDQVSRPRMGRRDKETPHGGGSHSPREQAIFLILVRIRLPEHERAGGWSHRWGSLRCRQFANRATRPLHTLTPPPHPSLLGFLSHYHSRSPSLSFESPGPNVHHSGPARQRVPGGSTRIDS